MMKKRKGIILAGGTGTRLYPLTIGVSKQLLPIFDKPMIYYPLTTLMMSGIKEILIITTTEDHAQFKRTLRDGSQWGIKLNYIVQPNPDGLAQAFILAEKFLNGAPSALILGDNIFFGHGLSKALSVANEQTIGASVFGYHVNDPERYGVVDFDEFNKVKSIIEKPKHPASNYAVTGLYFVDETAPSRAKKVKPSPRGELEITTFLQSYLDENRLTVDKMGRGFAWLDTGTHSSLLDASNFVRTLTERQGLQVGSPDEIAFQKEWIDSDQLMKSANDFAKSPYGNYLKNLLYNN
jgi:glucose-1-phosphate thymidylyltransferase